MAISSSSSALHRLWVGQLVRDQSSCDRGQSVPASLTRLPPKTDLACPALPRHRAVRAQTNILLDAYLLQRQAKGGRRSSSSRRPAGRSTHDQVALRQPPNPSFEPTPFALPTLHFLTHYRPISNRKRSHRHRPRKQSTHQEGWSAPGVERPTRRASSLLSSIPAYRPSHPSTRSISSR